MKQALNGLAFGLICGVLAPSAAVGQSPPPAPAVSADADGWMRENDGENLLRYLLADGVFSELQSAQMGLGIERTCQLVTQPFEKAVQDLRRPWTRMYRRVAAKFPYKPGNKGRETQLFFAIGLEAVDLLQPKVGAIIGPIQAEFARVDPDAINYEAALARIAEARADGRASCGLRGRVPRGPGVAQQKSGVK